MTQFSGYPRTTADADFFIQDLGTAAFYGLEFIDTAEDLVIPNQNMTCKPSVLIKGSIMVIDYGDCGTDTDRTFVNTLFTSMTGGNGFTLTNAIYDDVVTGYNADLAASCTLNSYTNYKIVATYSAIGSTTETNYFLGSNFQTIPQIEATAGLTSGVTSSRLINYTTSEDNSFLSKEFTTGDYIDVATSSNTGRYTISGITVDGFNREIITLSGSPIVTPEDLRTTETILTHSRKSYKTTANPVDFNNGIVYTVNIRTVNGTNYFEINGVVQDNLVMFRGSYYIFVEENYPAHGIGFSITPDGTHSGGVEYVDSGFYTIKDNSLGRRTYVVVPNGNTPDQLYYYCTSHSGMGASIRVSGAYSYVSAPTLTTNLNPATTTTSSAGSAY